MTLTVNSRLVVLNNPVLAPGKCILCGSAGGDGRKFIDFGKQIQWYGAVYFCTFCFVEFAEASGFVPVATFDKLHDEFRALQVKFDQLEAKYRPVESVLRNFYNASDDPLPDIGSYLGKFSSPTEESEAVESTNTESTERESEANKPVDVEGPDDIFDSTDFD